MPTNDPGGERSTEIQTVTDDELLSQVEFYQSQGHTETDAIRLAVSDALSSIGTR